MGCLSNLNGCELVTLANIVSISISQGLSSDEIATLAGFFTVVGDSLVAISLTSGKSEDNSSIQCQK